MNPMPAKAFDPFGIFFEFYDRHVPFQDYIDTERERHELRQYRRRERYRERRRYQQERHRDFEEYKRERFKKQKFIVPEPKVLRYQTSYDPDTIVIFTEARRLLYVINEDTLLEYPIAVGKEGYQWTGVETISRIQKWPSWRPTARMRAENPRLPGVVPGGPKNPLGAVAMYLGNTLYRIHGTNDPRSIGTFASSGCIRMHNEHALDLASRIGVGTKVIVRVR